MATKGFPELQQLYKLLGAPNNVTLHRGEHFPHNYNAVSRSAFYGVLNKHFKLGFKEPVIERDYSRLKRDELTVWDDKHPAPKAADPDFERKLLRWFHDDAQGQLASAAKSTTAGGVLAGEAIEILLGRALADAGEVEWNIVQKTDRGAWFEMSGLLRNKTYGEELPVVFCHPKDWNGTTVVWLGAEGKSSLYAGSSLQADVQKLVDSGATVLGVDLLYQGEFLADGKPLTQTGRVRNTREAAAYTFGYNQALFAQRVHDVLSVLKFIKTNERASKQLILVGLDGAGPIASAARAVSGDAIQRAVIDTEGFRFGQVLNIHDPNFLPGGAKYGDVPGLLALGAPGNLWLAGEGAQAAGAVREAYGAAKALEALVPSTGGRGQSRRLAVDWLVAGRK
jgi:hypothetical protein